MDTDSRVKLDLGDGTVMYVAAEPIGPALVADDDVVARLGAMTDSIGKLSTAVLDSVKKAGPSKATVEIGFTFGVETGQLIAMFGKAKGDTSLTVTLEWTKSQGG